MWDERAEGWRKDAISKGPSGTRPHVVRNRVQNSSPRISSGWQVPQVDGLKCHQAKPPPHLPAGSRSPENCKQLSWPLMALSRPHIERLSWHLAAEGPSPGYPSPFWIPTLKSSGLSKELTLSSQHLTIGPDLFFLRAFTKKGGGLTLQTLPLSLYHLQLRRAFPKDLRAIPPNVAAGKDGASVSSCLQEGGLYCSLMTLPAP